MPRASMCGLQRAGEKMVAQSKAAYLVSKNQRGLPGGRGNSADTADEEFGRQSLVCCGES